MKAAAPERKPLLIQNFVAPSAHAVLHDLTRLRAGIGARGATVADGGRGTKKVTVLVLARVGLQELQLGRIHVHPHARSLFGKGRVGGMRE